MGELLSYSTTSGLFMLALYLAYRLFLARDNQHVFNRSVLLCIYLVSFTSIPLYHTIENLIPQHSSQAFILEGIEFSEAFATQAHAPIWGSVLIWIYLSGMLIVTAKTIITWIKLIKVIRSGKHIKHEGYTLVITDNDSISPFSWIHFVVINRKDYDSNRSAIVTHELKHIAAHHWIDLLAAQIVCIVNWFNPASWLMRDELMLVHEYQADMAVIESGHNPQDYQLLLIKKAVGSRFPSLANSLNHSKLKKRITMMYKEKSSAGRKFRALALVPMLALAIGIASVPAVRAALVTIGNSAISVDKGNENLAANKITVQRFKITNLNSDGNETTVIIRGEGLGNNITVSGGTFTNDGNTYNATSLKCDMTDGVATITAIFPFSGLYSEPTMTLMVNGKEVPFELKNLAGDIQSISVKNKPDNASSGPIIIKGTSSSLPKDMAIYLDGKKISEAELKALGPDKIASISIDKNGKAISITSKE